MNLTLLKQLQKQTGALPQGVPATRSVTDLRDDQLKAVGGGGSGSSGGSGGGGGSAKR